MSAAALFFYLRNSECSQVRHGQPMTISTRSYPVSTLVLALAGIILMGIGLYFVFLRPALLPEDLRYLGASLPDVQAHVPGLLLWLRRVMWVMGGYMVATGLLTVYVAVTAFRVRAKGVAIVVALAGLTSIGWMALVNFTIDSDFKWLILSFVVLWSLALVLYRLESRAKQSLGHEPGER